ncbi:hypothetical protein ACOMHN_028646 [Nucella lapillus]
MQILSVTSPGHRPSTNRGLPTALPTALLTALPAVLGYTPTVDRKNPAEARTVRWCPSRSEEDASNSDISQRPTGLTPTSCTPWGEPGPSSGGPPG